jgi:hypothetical protein
MTTWTVVDDDHEGIVTHISDAGRQKYEDEQRLNSATNAQTAVLCGSAVGLVVSFARWVIVRILGA